MLGTLTCKTIGELDDGRAELIINAALKKAMDDLEGRGHDGKSREVTIVITACKVEGDAVAVDVQAKAKVPAQRTATTKAKLRHRRDASGLPVVEAVFQFDNPERPDQGTLNDHVADDGEIQE